MPFAFETIIDVGSKLLRIARFDTAWGFSGENFTRTQKSTTASASHTKFRIRNRKIRWRMTPKTPPTRNPRIVGDDISLPHDNQCRRSLRSVYYFHEINQVVVVK